MPDYPVHDGQSHGKDQTNRDRARFLGHLSGDGRVRGLRAARTGPASAADGFLDATAFSSSAPSRRASAVKKFIAGLEYKTRKKALGLRGLLQFVAETLGMYYCGFGAHLIYSDGSKVCFIARAEPSTAPRMPNTPEQIVFVLYVPSKTPQPDIVLRDLRAALDHMHALGSSLTGLKRQVQIVRQVLRAAVPVAAQAPPPPDDASEFRDSSSGGSRSTSSPGSSGSDDIGAGVRTQLVPGHEEAAGPMPRSSGVTTLGSNAGIEFRFQRAGRRCARREPSGCGRDSGTAFDRAAG